MGRTRIGRTDGRTDGLTDGRTDGRTRRRLYAPPKFFGEHNKEALSSRAQILINIACLPYIIYDNIL